MATESDVIKRRSQRTKNASVNVTVGLICQALTLIVNFIVRTAFIHTLGKEYLGVNGLFSNIWTILSFAELGIGNALVYSMYKPLATDDTKKLASLVALYRKVYNIIALVVAGVGLCFLPFLNVIIREKPDIPESIPILYLLFLADTVVSYIFTYKKSIIIADQRNYVVLIITEVVKIATRVVQIIVLYRFRAYIAFLFITIIGTILTNVISAIVANRLYPYIKEKAEPLEKAERQSIFSNVKALAAFKFGNVILDGTDNILISMLDKIASVGVLSNYTLINQAVYAILAKVKDGLTSSIGNLNTIDDKEKQEEIFNSLLFMCSWICGFAVVGLLLCTSTLIRVWIGEDYVLDPVSHTAIMIGFYLDSMNYPARTYRQTLGLFREARFAPVWAAVINIVLSVALYYVVGFPGIFIATPIARIATICTVDPYFVYKKVFHKSLWSYYSKYLGYFAFNATIYIGCYFLSRFIPYEGWLRFILQVVLVTMVYNGLTLIVFHRTKQFKTITDRIFAMLKRKK